MMNDSFFSLAGAVLTVGCILFLAYWCSRLMGKTYMKATSGRNLKILEQVRISADKQILLVKLQSTCTLSASARPESSFWKSWKRNTRNQKKGRRQMNDLLAGLNGGNVPALDLIFMITLVALLPSIAVMMTSFTRTIIILSFTRNAMGIQQTPPNTVLVGISLFLTLYIMSPVIGRVNAEAYEPYTRGEITQMEAVQRMGVPIKEFMLRNTEKETLDHFVEMSGTQTEERVEDYPFTVVTPAFMTSELKRGFVAGFLIYLPFLLIDIVVATTLMSMGMVMLPPTMVSLPFKLLLFVTVNGWELLFSSIVRSFR